MKKSLLLFGTGIIATLLLFEVVFRLLPVSTATRSGYYIHPAILTYPAHHCFTAATGWDLKNAQKNCTNNLGFLADRDFVHDPQAIALIGDSFVEANMLPAPERLAAQLETRLKGRPVYALGGPGSSLLDYAERAKFAAEKFGTRIFVFVLERGDVKQAICGSGNIHGPCIDAKTLLQKVETQPPPNDVKRLVRQSALAQYVFSQLKFDISKVLLKPSQPSGSGDGRRDEDVSVPLPVSKVVNNFFKEISTIENAHFLFLVDADRAHLSNSPINESSELKLLKEKADMMQAIVIDPTADFQRFVADSGRILEMGPYDHHWSGNTVQILADLISTSLLKFKENR